ncbi:cation:proton antiporter [Xylanimonas protaetiae]|uniref:Sodium:proton antiporter n=1 Tax=Xylanimonas protaetiae TaxID=2509457 RepID=A0A4P6F7A1_9MICO|nr:cation:proton antiporter [Xylanimonas protaetiae]QAY70229.1 sodium:proton antiporter [Xylanimonas protaetiae]
MTELLVLAVATLVVIAAATVAGPRLGLASPLVLVLIGVGASLLPMFGDLHIDPEWILQGVLPPLLYSSAVSMPAMNFRREFGAISGLSVVLVVASSLVLGLFFLVAIPGLGLAWGVALGAIISPTDAVATSIVKQTTVSKRVVAMLDGESLLNDATALVLLRTTIVATAAAFSFWGAVGTFAWSVVVAVVVGGAVGVANLLVRKKVTDSAVNTVISFAVPFVASVPATLLGGSGLVAAVVAGLVTGIRAPRLLSPRNRLSDAENWRTVELVLEGLVFLTMGLQVREVVTAVGQEHDGVGTAVLLAVAALVLTILVRAAYVAPLLRSLSRRARRGALLQERMQGLQAQLATPEGQEHALTKTRGSQRRVEQFTRRVTQTLADIDYFRRQPLGWREGTAVVWAGMRGAVTVAAAQTLPPDTPHRALLVLVAFSVAMLSLLLQGGTIGPLLRRIAPPVDPGAATQDDAERARILDLLKESALGVPAPATGAGDRSPEAFAASRAHRLAVLDAQRAALLDARDHGTFDADVLEDALVNLDASQLAIELRGKLAGQPVDV